MSTTPPPSQDPPTLTLLLGPTKLTLTVGACVLVRKPDGDCYGAVIEAIDGLMVSLTFTPHGAPRTVPAGAIITTVPTRSNPAILKPPLIPQHQPLTSVAPRRREGMG